VRYAAAALTLAFSGLAPPAFAQALQTGQCLPAAQVRATLAAEGQNPIILGTRTGYGYGTALIFTSNADGSRGYLIRGDKPLGQQADTICIDSVYRDIRLNDIARPGIPAWAAITVDAARAEADCRENRLGFQEMCQPHDQSLANLQSHGVNVMLMATGTVINPRDRSSRSDQTIVLMVDPSDQAGVLKAVSDTGASYMLSAYTKASYTQHGTALLAGS
jgi:hypothetical protein